MSTTLTSPGAGAARLDPQARLGGVEGRRRARHHGESRRLAGRGIDAARHVGGEHGNAAVADRFDRGGDRAARLPARAGSEQSVDHERRVGRDRIAGELGAAPGRRVARASRRASPENSPGPPASSTSTSRPSPRSSRAATRPSPPLLPLPATTTIRPSGAIAAARPARPRAGVLHQLKRRHLTLLDRPRCRSRASPPRHTAARASQAGLIAAPPPRPPCRACASSIRRPRRRAPARERVRRRAAPGRPPRRRPRTSTSWGDEDAQPECLRYRLLGAEPRREVLRRLRARRRRTRARPDGTGAARARGGASSARSIRSISSRSRPIPVAATLTRLPDSFPPPISPYVSARSPPEASP